MHTMYVLNVNAIREAARKRGYRGLASLMRKIGMHRNSLNRYLSGAGVLPQSLEKIIEELDLPIEQVLTRVFEKKASMEVGIVLPLVAKLSEIEPHASFVLFGSRARGTARRYSDFDIGVLKPGTLSFSEYQILLAQKEEFEDNSAYYVDLVDLAKADSDFLKEVLRDGQLLVGRYSDFFSLCKEKGVLE